VKRPVLAKAAKTDLAEIKAYLEEQAGPQEARRILLEIRKAITRIAANPGIGHSRSDLSPLLFRFYSVYRYMIVFVETGKSLQIARILHGNRNLKAML
jgi:plasmid stabilization system protein ParE